MPTCYHVVIPTVTQRIPNNMGNIASYATEHIFTLAKFTHIYLPTHIFI